MIRLLFRLALLAAVVIAALAAYALSDGWGGWGRDDETAAATERSGPLNSERARQAGAELVESLAAGASRAGEALDEGRLTTKIRVKMQLDDTIDPSGVNVDTQGTVVTLRGEIANRQQHQRVVQLARETAGVTSVVDQLTVREP